MNRTIGSSLEGRENNFDFIRFMAALIVIYSHSFLLTGSIAKEPMMVLTSGHYDTAHLSVAAFFIISGCLITRSFIRAKSAREYFEARILRIYPALIVVIIFTVFIIGPFYTTYNLRDYFFNYETIKYFILNSLMVKVQFTLPGVFESGEGSTINPSLWTLPIELACYCIVAIGGLIANKRIVAGMLLGIVTLSMFYYTFNNGFISLFFYFFIGALMYFFRGKIILNSMIAFLAFILLFGILNYNTNLDANFALKSINIILKGLTLSYIIMYLSFLKITYVKGFAKYGDFSYGLYIWAFPLQQIIKTHLGPIGPYTLFTISAFVALIFSALSWHLVEKRALRLKNKYKFNFYRKPKQAGLS